MSGFRSLKIEYEQRVTEDVLQRSYVDQEMSVRDIAAACNVSPGTIYRRLELFGIDIEQRPAENHRPELAERLTYEYLEQRYRRDTLPVEKIAVENDCSVQTVYSYLRRHQIALEPDRKQQRALSERLSAELLHSEYHEEGSSLREVAERHHVSTAQLRKLMDGYGIPRRQVAVDLPDDQVRQLYVNERLAMKEIAKRAGCSIWSVRQRLNALGIEVRPSTGRSGESEASTDR